jgi:drug/metabolite transporter (DMT)-like permease
VTTVLAILGAVAASVCFGAAAVLQAVGARRIEPAHGIDLRLLWRLSHSRPYLAGVGLDVVGVGLAVVAMRSLPVFAVEAIFASYVAVAAALAAATLGSRLRPAEWWALAGVCAGLVLLGSSAGAQSNPPVGAAPRWVLLATVVVLGAAAAVAGRLASAGAAAVMAFLGGLAWGLIPIATRILRDPGSLTGLLGDPAAYSILAAGGLGLLLYTLALQRMGVTAATALAIVGETLVPAAVGIVVLGDQPRPGAGAPAVAGFVLTVGGALVLARYGDIEPPSPRASVKRESGRRHRCNRTPRGRPRH